MAPSLTKINTYVPCVVGCRLVYEQLGKDVLFYSGDLYLQENLLWHDSLPSDIIIAPAKSEISISEIGFWVVKKNIQIKKN